MKKVVVGMSGGVDSFVTALLLRRQGYEVIGVTLELWEKNDLSGVRDSCEKLNIPLLCREGRELFRQQVVDPFVKAYRSGLTPSPCSICNRRVKWILLQQVADELGVEYIATDIMSGLPNGREDFISGKGSILRRISLTFCGACLRRF